MKMNYFFTLLMFFVSIKIGLTQKKITYPDKITYKLVYIPDSSNFEDKRYEFTYLFYKEGESFFQSQSGYRVDSSKGTILLNNPIKDIVIKNGKDSITSIGFIPSYYYSYIEPEKIKWQLLPDTLQIGRWVCQKAVTHLGGRDWTAWFAQDIPIPDGPYKFNGLPGLVLRVEDSQHFFIFTIERIEHKNTTIDISIYNEAKETSKKKFFALRKAFRENPLPFMSQGKTFTSGINEIMANVKAKINKNNNLIERSNN